MGHILWGFSYLFTKTALQTAGSNVLLFYSFETYSIHFTNATISGAVLAVSPVLAIIFALISLREFPTKRQAVFCILPVIGVMIMTVAGNSLGIVTPKGAVFLTLTCIVSGAYKTVNRKTEEEFTSFERTYIMLVASAIGFGVIKNTNHNLKRKCRRC